MPSQKNLPPQAGYNGLREKRVYTADTINQAFNEFLRLGNLDRRILTRYHDALRQGGEQFAKVFYDYLLANPVTAKVLQDYQAGGGKIDDLVKR